MDEKLCYTVLVIKSAYYTDQFASGKHVESGEKPGESVTVIPPGEVKSDTRICVTFLPSPENEVYCVLRGITVTRSFLLLFLCVPNNKPSPSHNSFSSLTFRIVWYETNAIDNNSRCQLPLTPAVFSSLKSANLEHINRKAGTAGNSVI